MARTRDVVRMIVVATIEHHALSGNPLKASRTQMRSKRREVIATMLIKRNHHDKAWWCRCGLERC
jgi:hypothetical protein